MPLREKIALLKELILPGLVAFSVLGSLYLGWATPTEAAGVGVAGAVLAAGWNRKLSWAKLRARRRATRPRSRRCCTGCSSARRR